jgi:hypothetical protein
MTNDIYDRDYFIRFFESIPAEKWTQHMLDNGNGQRCAAGHVRALTLTKMSDCRITPMETALGLLFNPRNALEGLRMVVSTNDCADYRGPKAAVLDALRALPVSYATPILSVTVTDKEPDFVPDAPRVEVPVLTESEFLSFLELINARPMVFNASALKILEAVHG